MNGLGLQASDFVRAVLVLVLATALLVPAGAVGAQRADPRDFLLTSDELPRGFEHQANRDDDQVTSGWSNTSRVYWRFNPEVAPDDITSLHMNVTVYNTVAEAAASLVRVRPELLLNFEHVEPMSLVGEEGFLLWQSIPLEEERQAEAWYVLFRVGPVVARSRWGDYDDLPNLNYALDLARALEAKIRDRYP